MFTVAEMEIKRTQVSLVGIEFWEKMSYDYAMAKNLLNTGR